ncbi:MAG: heat shock protein transcriptional repressor HspR [Acidimicrobiales bacterium]
MNRGFANLNTRAVYVISVAAELAGMHPQTLRVYERKGLLDPARTGGGSRRYSDADIAMLRRIQELTNEGLNLAGVKRVLELEYRLADTEAELARARQALHDTVVQANEAISHAVAEAHREYRRDLVPVRQSVELYDHRRARR